MPQAGDGPREDRGGDGRARRVRGRRDRSPDAQLRREALGALQGTHSPREVAKGIIHKSRDHSTIRTSDEVKWADEYGQLKIIDSIIEASAAATFGAVNGKLAMRGWAKVFGDEMAASAIADRVCHHWHMAHHHWRTWHRYVGV